MSLPIIITFRESFEMLLIIIPMIIYLNKASRKDLSKYIYFGVSTGIVTSFITGGVLYNQISKLSGEMQDLFFGLMMIFLATLILYNIVWVSKNNKQLSTNITDKYNMSLTGVGLFILSFITVFRECLEIIMFLIPVENKNTIMVLGGVGIGLLLATIVSYIIYRTSMKLSISIIFNILTILLIIMGGMLLGEGLLEVFPKYGKSIEQLGELIYIIPLLFLYIKRELKKYQKKR